jgi:hypothetical protein
MDMGYGYIWDPWDMDMGYRIWDMDMGYGI